MLVSIVAIFILKLFEVLNPKLTKNKTMLGSNLDFLLLDFVSKVLSDLI